MIELKRGLLKYTTVFLVVYFFGTSFGELVYAQSAPDTSPEIVEVVSEKTAPCKIEKIPGGDEVFGDFVVGPTKIELSIEPGRDKNIELLVTNRMGVKKVFNLEIEDAQGSYDVDQPIMLLGDDRGPYSLKDYIKFSHKSFTLEHGERARIPVKVAIPEDAQPGGLYGSVLVTTASASDSEVDNGRMGAKPGSVIVSRIGALFFVTIPGATDRAGQMQSFKTIPDTMFFSGGPINFQILYENTGSVHVSPYGSISIKNMLGDEVGVVTADPWFAMPKSVRLRELSFDRPYLFGKYTAEATINRGYDNIIDTATVTFIVIPWKLLGGAFLSLVFLIFVIRLIMRTFEIKRK